jgi:hypothetical protein
MSKIRVVPVGDLHLGSTVSVSPDKFYMPDGNAFLPSPRQEIINKLWRTKMDRVFADKIPVVLVLNGDLVEGGRPGQPECWAPRMKDQMDAAVQILKPLADKAMDVIVVSGTPFHVQGLGNVEDAIAEKLGAYENKAHKRARFTVEGVTFEFVHKGPKFGNRIWTWGNNVRSQVMTNIMRDALVGRSIVDVYCYSHYHRCADSGLVMVDLPGGGQLSSRGLILPSWKLIDEWTNHTDAPMADIGLVYFDVAESDYTVIKDYESFDPTTEIKIGGKNGRSKSRR